MATHLCVAMADGVQELIHVNSRTLEDLPEDSDLYILAVSDEAIAKVASRLPRLKGVVAHTSGSMPMSELQCVDGPTGVFYPLMTFSRDADIDYRQIPVFIEGSDQAATDILRWAASRFTDRITEMDSARRMKMHIASVFACNFANALWQVADDLMTCEDVPFKYLLPLIDASAEKLHHLTPAQSQTGPARRGDLSVVEKHESMLESQPEIKKLYHELSQLIIAQANNHVID